MKLDPNKHCSLFKQNPFWAVIHDAIAHPLMAITGYCKFSIAFHDFTSQRAWKRASKVVKT